MGVCIVCEEQIVLLGDETNRDVFHSGVRVANVREKPCTHVQIIRERNVKAVYCKGAGNIKKALKEVARQQLRYAVLLGTNELSLLNQSKLLVKDMASREQKEMNIDAFLSLLYHSSVCFVHPSDCTESGVFWAIIKKKMSSSLTPPVGYKPVKGNCSLPEKIVNKKENEIWLIRTPKTVYV